MSFQFRLEKVLQHRKTLEDLAKKNYLEAKTVLDEAEALLESFHQSIRQAQSERHKLVVSGQNPGERLSQISDYIKGTELKIERQKSMILKQLAIVEKQHRALQEAAIEYKMVEKLKERQLFNYRELEKKLEQKEQTEISNSRFEMRRRKDEQ